MRLVHPSGVVGVPWLLPTGGLLWVDSKTGNNGLAVRGGMGVPFATLTAAKLAAQAGDTICVLPGTYDEKNLLKDKVNWFFYPGAKVVYSGAPAGATPGAIFDTGINGSNAAVESIVAGYGDFRLINSSGGKSHAINSEIYNSKLSIEANSLWAADTCILIGSNSSAGSLSVKVRGEVRADSGDGIRCEGAMPVVLVEADQVRALAGIGLQVTSGSVHLRARSLISDTNLAVRISGGTGTTVVDVREVVATIYMTVRHATSSAAIVHLINSRVTAGGTGAPAIDITQNIATYANPLVKLTGCVLLPAGTSPGINAVHANTKVQFNGDSVSKVAANANVSAQGGTLKVGSVG